MKKLRELADFVMGQAPPGELCNCDGQGTVFVKAGEFGERRPVVREWTTQPLRLAERGDVLVCVVGATAGKINLGIDCAIGRSVAAIRPFPEQLDQRFRHSSLIPTTSRMMFRRKYNEQKQLRSIERIATRFVLYRPFRLPLAGASSCLSACYAILSLRERWA